MVPLPKDVRPQLHAKKARIHQRVRLIKAQYADTKKRHDAIERQLQTALETIDRLELQYQKQQRSSRRSVIKRDTTWKQQLHNGEDVSACDDRRETAITSKRRNREQLRRSRKLLEDTTLSYSTLLQEWRRTDQRQIALKQLLHIQEDALKEVQQQRLQFEQTVLACLRIPERYRTDGAYEIQIFSQQVGVKDHVQVYNVFLSHNGAPPLGDNHGHVACPVRPDGSYDIFSYRRPPGAPHGSHNYGSRSMVE